MYTADKQTRAEYYIDQGAVSASIQSGFSFCVGMRLEKLQSSFSQLTLPAVRSDCVVFVLA